MPITPMTAAGLAAYLRVCRTVLPTDAILVRGHDAPDTDAVVSALAEGYRRHLVDGSPCVPFVPADCLPREVAFLLGGDLSVTVPLAADIPAPTESTRYILTDHHDAPPVGRVVAIRDHHLPTHPLSVADAVFCAVGSTTTLIVDACRRDGLLPDAAMARILLGGILADTEGLSPAKTRDTDRDAADWLTALWGGDPAALFRAMHAELLAETDLTTLYRRDYRRFGDALGFAVLKVWDTAAIDKGALRELLARDRETSGLTVTLAKITRYAADGLTDETYFVSADDDIAAALLAAISAAAGEGGPLTSPDRIHLPRDTHHLSRKRLMPIIAPILKNL